MTSKRYWLNKGSYSMFNRFVIFFFSFASYFVLVRYFEKVDFGIYTLYMVIITFIETARNSFVQNGFLKYYLKDQNEYQKREVLTSSFLLNILLSSTIAIILFLSADWIGEIYDSESLGSMVKIFCLVSPFLIVYSQNLYYQNSQMNFRVIALVSFIRYASFFVCTVFFYFSPIKLTLINVIYFHAGSIILGTIVSLSITKVAIFKLTRINWSQVYSLFHFGKYTFGTGITSLLTRSVDQMMIGYFIGSEAVASYNVAGRFLNFIEIPITSISQVLYPKFAATINYKDQAKELARLYEKSTGLILAVIAPFVFAILFFSSFLITIVAGENYLDAVPILQMFMIMNLLKPLATQSGAVLEANGKPKVIFHGLLVSLLVNIILNYFLIRMEGPFGGAIGAAIASMISGSLSIVIAMVVTYRTCRFSGIGIFKEIIKTYQLIFKLVLDKVKGF